MLPQDLDIPDLVLGEQRIILSFLRLLLMDKILHDLKDSKLWELWYIPYNGYCRILSINSINNTVLLKLPSP